MVGSVCEELAWLWDGVGGGCSTIEAWEQWQKVGDAAEYLIKAGNTQLTAPLCPRPLNHCQCPTMQIEIMLHQGKWNFQRKKKHNSSNGLYFFHTDVYKHQLMVFFSALKDMKLHILLRYRTHHHWVIVEEGCS